MTTTTTKRIKRVFRAYMVAHLWANQSQDSARTSSGNFSFDGPDLWSYSTKIGRIYTLADGSKVALLSSRDYSKTTAKQITYAERATSYPTYRVPNPITDLESCHLDNWQHLRAEMLAALGKAKRARTSGQWHLETAEKLRNQCNAYRAAFLPENESATEILPDASLAELSARIAAENAEREAKRIAVEQQRLAYWLEVGLPQWRQTGRWVPSVEFTGHTSLQYSAPPYAPVAFRIDGETVHTTKGAEFPSSHCAAIWRIVERTRKSGLPFIADLQSGPRIGHFRVDQITTSGDVIAGCHHVAYAEVRWLAQQLRLPGSFTLAEWSESTGIEVENVVRTDGGPSGTCVISTQANDRHSDLFHLSDYAVSTVSGIVVWLVPR